MDQNSANLAYAEAAYDAGIIPRRRIGRPPRGGSQIVTDTIIAVATRLFLTEGYASTNMDAVANRSGSSKRTLYARFPSKAALFEAVVRTFVKTKVREVKIALLMEGTLEEILVAAGERILRSTLDPDGIALHRVIIAEAPRFPDLARIIEESAQPAVDFMHEIFRGAKARGEIACTAEIDPLVRMFASIVHCRPLQDALLGADPAVIAAQAERDIRNAVKLLLDGCRPAR
ncbi:TetR/AcrR family transcriptional regulator [Segnochrobactrum spirostomi]|nr:TetR/AcrR family transcriptional regulator [Segnochrobactrum spirostomi]